MVPSTSLALATNIRTYKDTEIQRYKATKIHTLTTLTYELFFQNSSTRLDFAGFCLTIQRKKFLQLTK